MTLDVLYVAWNRLAFTKATFVALIDNTDWSLVRRLVVYDDGSEDGTAEWLRSAATDVSVVPVVLRETALRSPVAVMNDYIGQSDADVFAKIDNDIMVPPGWLNTMKQVMDADPELELLGMEAGRTPHAEHSDVPYVTGAQHIGGVGLMRLWSFKRRPRLVADGRFGFTEWQHQYFPKLGWVTPDLPVCSLDRIPFDPWVSLSAKYVANGWQREWSTYWPDSGYWEWWPPHLREEAP